MNRIFLSMSLALVACVGMWIDRSAQAADEYTYDLVHSSVSFKARHLDLSWIHGRFNQVEGTISIDRQEPSK